MTVELPPAEILTVVEDIVGPAFSTRRFLARQRHHSWYVESATGQAIWVKIERSVSPVAGVDHEAASLRMMASYVRVPEVLSSGSVDGSSYMITRHLIGRRPSVQDIDGLACGLAEFSDSVEAYVGPICPGSTLFSEDVHLPSLIADDLGPCLHQLLIRVREAWSPERRSLVHGSFDLDNVRFDDQLGIGFLDLEALRRGPASFDVAALAGALAESGQVDAARLWLAACSRTFGVKWYPVNIAGYLLLRYILRIRSGSTIPDMSLLPRLAAELSGIAK